MQKEGKAVLRLAMNYSNHLKKLSYTHDAKTQLTNFKEYSYQVDRLTGDITRRLEDDHNHAIDALDTHFIVQIINFTNLKN